MQVNIKQVAPGTPGAWTPYGGQAQFLQSTDYMVFIYGGTGTGKAQPVSSLVATPDGWTPIGELSVGSEVFGPSGQLTEVLEVHPQGKKSIYTVTFSDGTSTDCCDEHLWLTESKQGQDIRTTKEIAETLADGHCVPITQAVEYPEREYVIDPYTFGATTPDVIPPEYLLGSVEQRFALLHGLMDTDGELVDGYPSYPARSAVFARSLCELVRSLGGIAITSLRETRLRTQGNALYDVAVHIPQHPFSRFRAVEIDLDKYRKEIVEIRYKEEADAVCISVADPSGLYLTNDYIVTHNTTTCCTKMVMLCMKYPGCKFLFTRRHYAALIKSGVETLERVLKEFGFKIGKGNNAIQKIGQSKPTEYIFPYAKNFDPKSGRTFEGQSRIVLASLDNVKDELGAEYDFIYVNQPEQATEEDWQILMTRADGRYNHAPYPQLFGDPNPDSAHHWIKRGGYELDENGVPDNPNGRWRLIKSTYRDNPILWDMEKDCFTPEGELRINRLAQGMNSVTKKRLLDSEWVSAEGLVFGDVWDPTHHVINKDQFYQLVGDDFGTWERYWAIDYGYDDPFVASFWAKHPEEDLYVRYKLIYMTGRTINEHVNTIKEVTLGEPRPKLVVSDRSPGERAILSEALGIHVISAKKGVGSRRTGVNVLTDMLKNRKLVFYKDALVEADKRLLELKRPIGFEEEVLSYAWHPRNPDEPQDGLDHECYTKDTEVLTPLGWKSLAEVDKADTVVAVTQTGSMLLETPKDIIKKSYTGEIININHMNLQFTSTIGHYHATITQMDWKRREIFNLKKVDYNNLPAVSFWPTNIPNWSAGSGYFEQGADEAWFAGFWLADGCFHKRRPSYLIVYQNEGPAADEVRERLNRLGWTFSESVNGKNIQFTVSRQRERAEKYESIFNDLAKNKYLPPWVIFAMTKDEREQLWEGYMLGDGSRTGSAWHFDSTSKNLVDGIQLLSLTLGYGSNIYSYDCMAEGREMLSPNGNTYKARQSWRGSVRRSKQVSQITKDMFSKEHVEDLPVYCITTSTGFFLARTNGRVFVAGNCDAIRYLFTHIATDMKVVPLIWI